MAFDIVSNIPQAKRAEVRDAIWEILPNNETIPDPEWVDPEDGTTAPEIPKYTDAEWGDEIVWTYLKRLYLKGRNRIRDRDAVDLTNIRE